MRTRPPNPPAVFVLLGSAIIAGALASLYDSRLAFFAAGLALGALLSRFVVQEP